MQAFNQVNLAGNITRDPELRYTPAGRAVVSFALALNSKWTDDQGVQHDDVTFVDCVAWEGRAEVAAKYVRKGDPLLITGKLKQEKWEDKQTGQQRTKLVVVVANLVFLTGKKDGQAQPAPEKRGAAPAPAAPENVVPSDDEDVPY